MGIFLALSVLSLSFWATPALAAVIDTTSATTATGPEVEGRYGSIVVNADTLEIIHARQIDAQRYPASLTKLMTLYLVFDALEQGQLTLDQALPISRNAQNTPPGKLGVKVGQTITVHEAIQAVAVKSANDVAVVLAEAVGGSEAGFAEAMTARAASLGMLKTQYSNPHGLPNPLQVTTARDMAKLATAHLNNHRKYYHYFGQTKFRYKGKTYNNTNGLLHWLDGVDGFKTGYTRASGYNLVISAKRDGHRIIAVVLGGASNKSRNTHMQDLIERSFDTIGVTAVSSSMVASAPVPAAAKIKPKTARTIVREPVPTKVAVRKARSNAVTRKAIAAEPITAVRLRGRNQKPVTIVTSGAKVNLQPAAALDRAWSIQIGAFNTEFAAQSQIDGVAPLIGTGGTPIISSVQMAGRTLYRARYSAMTFEQAHGKCRALSALKTGCQVIYASATRGG